MAENAKTSTAARDSRERAAVEQLIVGELKMSRKVWRRRRTSSSTGCREAASRPDRRRRHGDYRTTRLHQGTPITSYRNQRRGGRDASACDARGGVVATSRGVDAPPIISSRTGPGVLDEGHEIPTSTRRQGNIANLVAMAPDEKIEPSMLIVRRGQFIRWPAAAVRQETELPAFSTRAGASRQGR